LSTIALLALLGSGICFLALRIITNIGSGSPVIAAILVLSAVLIATGIRWMPLLGSLLSGFFLIVLLFFLHFVVLLLTHPQYAVNQFEVPVIVLLLTCLGVGFVAGIGATVQNYRRSQTQR